MAARLLAVFLAFFFFFGIVTSAFAQTQPNYLAGSTNPDVPQNISTLSQTVFIEVAATIICQISGIDPVRPNGQCLGVDPTTEKIGLVKNSGGAISLMGNMIAMLYTPPANSGQFTSYLASHFGIAKPAYAQTSLQALSPLLNIWLIFRNLVYLLFVLVFVLIGAGIMLRIKIDPRTVMSIENQIPKIIIGLVMVTFSYTIAAFLIDLMWVGTHLMVNVVTSMSPNNISPSAVNGNLNTPVPGFANEIYNDPSAPVTGNKLGGIVAMSSQAGFQLQGIIQSMFAPLSFTQIDAKANKKISECKPIDIFCWIGAKAEHAVGESVTQALGWTLSWIIGILAFLVLTIAILWAMFQTWFSLLKAYIFLLLDVALSPLWIISGAFPGGPGPAGWFRDIISNLITFPTVITFLLLGKVFVNEFSQATVSNPFVPPLIGTPTPLNLGSLIGVGFILMTPVMLDRVRQAFKAPNIDLSPIGAAIGAGTGAANLPGHATSIGQQVYYWQHAKQGIQALPGIGKMFGKGTPHPGP